MGIPAGFPSMDGRICIVTGANSGIGKAITAGLARLGATVVLACRSVERGEAARSEVVEQTGNRKLAVMELDLARLASVRQFADAFTARYPKLHVLVENAGLFTAKRVVTEDGIESTFASNHLGHFLLTSLLLDRLKQSAPSRVVIVSSEANQMGKMRFEDLTLGDRWSGMAAYAQSKLANVLFAFELSRRVQGTGVTANAVHPGVVRTGFAQRDGGWMKVGTWIARPFMISPAKGADTAVWLAASPEVGGVSGEYFYKRTRIEPNSIARDAAVARHLWDVSEQLIGLSGSAAPTPS